MLQRKFAKAVALLSLSIGVSVAHAALLSPQETLGQLLFFDTNLSDPDGQACASCHAPGRGFAEPDGHLPVSEGVIPGRFGTRNAPSAGYALYFPEFTLKRGVLGGQFWDGRAANLTEQAKGPFLNPVEMNNTSKSAVLVEIQASEYAGLFLQVCGPGAFDAANVEAAYHCMAEAIAAFERTSVFHPFTSKFDAVAAGLAAFTPQEAQGFDLFRGRGKCAHCHTAKPVDNQPAAIFTDAKYHNIGLPSNPEIFQLRPDLPSDFVDLGLGGVLGDSRENGKFKTTHLRNVELTAPYMHNGVLATLEEVVNFYNTRDIPGMWPAPEVPDNLDSSFLGDLGLTAEEEAAIVAFLKTLTDGYTPP